MISNVTVLPYIKEMTAVATEQASSGRASGGSRSVIPNFTDMTAIFARLHVVYQGVER